MDKNSHGGHPYYMCESLRARRTHMFVPFALVSGIGPHLVAILPPLRRYITSAPSPILIRRSPIMLTVHETMAFNTSRSCQSQQQALVKLREMAESQCNIRWEQFHLGP